MKQWLRRRLAIRWLRKVAAALEPEHTFALQLPSGKTASWKGSELREYFQTLADMIEANIKHDRHAQLAAITKLQALSANDDLPADEVEIGWQLLCKQLDR